MSKIFSFYSNDVDTVWYESSNIKYSKCIDKEGQLKTLDVVFNNGTQYRYKNVDVTQYLFFRDALSQGKALNEYIKAKGYEYEKLENADVDSLEKELDFRRNGGIFVNYDGNTLTLRDGKDVIIFEKETKLTKEAFDTMCEVLNAVGKDLFVEGKGFENGEGEEN